MNLPIVEPYVVFNGRTEEALRFYESAIGAKTVCLMRFEDAPEKPPEEMRQPGFSEKNIMHAAFTIGDSTIMASDGCGENQPVSGISLSISYEKIDEVEIAFKALAEGGEITMPLGKTFWSPLFGMVKDQFGIHWMLGVLDPNCMEK